MQSISKQWNCKHVYNNSQRAFENEAELRIEGFVIQKELSVIVIVASNKPHHQSREPTNYMSRYQDT
jgi:hypothetical protein